MKIFIIGGAGYIGSHMAKISFENNYDMILLDNLSTGHKRFLKYGKFEYCDIHDSKRLSELFKLYQPKVVIHFGANSIVAESVKNPYKYYYNNVAGTLNLLKIMIDNNCKKIIFSSTAAVFGNPLYLPIDEEHPKNPINPYGKSKLMIENILKDFDIAYGLKYIILRYFNASGEDKDGELFEDHKPETHLIPLIREVIQNKREYISIFGDDYNTKDGTCIRDYIHVEDLANVHISAIKYILKHNQSQDYNLGNGSGFSVKEVIDAMKSISGIDFTVKVEERRHGDPEILIASNKKAVKDLKFNPKYVDIDDIIKTVLKDKNVQK